MKMFVVYDSAAEAYRNPMYYTSTGEAVRDFSTAANNKESFLAKHPDDYTLFEIGSYDPQSASFEILPTPKSLGKALEYISKGV